MSTEQDQIAVIKLSTSLVNHKDNSLNEGNIQAYVAQIMQREIREQYKIILVSSGAIATGKFLLNGTCANGGTIEEGKLQEYASIGQPHLFIAFYNALLEHKALASQVLVTNQELQDPKTREKILATLRWNLRETRKQIVPIVNENDTVATDEFITDNDEIAGKISELVHAKVLLLLTNTNGVLAGMHDPDSRISTFAAGSREWERYVHDTPNGRNRGGMTSKCEVGSRLSLQGIRVVIANGSDPQNDPTLIARALLRPGEDGTTFLPAE